MIQGKSRQKTKTYSFGIGPWCDRKRRIAGSMQTQRKIIGIGNRNLSSFDMFCRTRQGANTAVQNLLKFIPI